MERDCVVLLCWWRDWYCCCRRRLRVIELGIRDGCAAMVAVVVVDDGSENTSVIVVDHDGVVCVVKLEIREIVGNKQDAKRGRDSGYLT